MDDDSLQMVEKLVQYFYTVNVYDEDLLWPNISPLQVHARMW
jgi:hypothetical protein